MEQLNGTNSWGMWTALGLLGIATLCSRAGPSRSNRTVYQILWAVPLAVAAMALAYRMRWIGDDAFISFRYARNLVEGHGLVFNPGERVEGYTNFFWTLLIAAGIAMSLSPILWSVVLSLTSLAAVVVLLQVLALKLLRHSRSIPVSIAAVAVAGSYLMGNFGTSGLETMFACALVLGGLYAAVAGRAGVAGLLGILATLSHPDQLLFYLALGAALLFDPRWKNPRRLFADRDYRRKVLLYLAPLVLIFVPYYIWRTSYYGYFFPNTYYAKSGGATYFEQGARYLGIAWIGAGLLGVLPLALCGAWMRRKDLIGRYLFLIVPLFTFYVAKIGGDFMFGRLIVSLVPLLLLGAELALDGWSIATSRFRWVVLAPGTFGFFLAALPVQIIRDGEKFWHVSDERTFYSIDQLSTEGIRSHYRQRAVDLKKHVLAYGLDPLLGAGNVGIVGFLSQVRIVDLLALTDPAVAHMPITIRSRPGHEKIARGPYLLKRNVDLSDDPIFPHPYSKDTEVRVGNTPYYLGGYKPRLIGAWKESRAVKVPNMPTKIRARLHRKSSLPEVAACDLWFFDTYYFKHNDDPQLLKRVVEHANDSFPDLEGGAALYFASQESKGWHSTLLFDMEHLKGWQVTGDAFAEGAVTSPITDLGFVYGNEGKLVASYPVGLRDEAVGELMSPPFIVTGEFITIALGGGGIDAGVGVELLVDGQVVQRVAGCYAEMLGRKVLSTRDLKGRKAQLRIFDRSKGGWGHVLVDEVRQWSR